MTVTLHLGDCLEYMKSMPDKSVDLTVTSPPYNVGLKYGEYNDNQKWDLFLSWLNDIYTELYRVTNDGGRVYSVLSDKLMFELKPALEEIGFTFGQVLTWCKPNLSGGASRITGDWNFLTEQILLVRKGKRVPMINSSGNTHSFFVIATPQSNFHEGRFHPAQFPLELPDRIIARTPGKIVFDPFMGSGSTGMAAVRNGRDFIGCELDKAYFKVARNRIDQAVQRPTLPLVQQSEIPSMGAA